MTKLISFCTPMFHLYSVVTQGAYLGSITAINHDTAPYSGIVCERGRERDKVNYIKRESNKR